MRVLIIGGTYFVGRNIVEELINRKHEITLFNRGTKKDIFNVLSRISGDRNTDDIQKLKDKKFDCVIDVCGYEPNQVSNLIDIIKDTIPYYIYVSSTAAILGNDTYAKNKKLCEDEIIKKYEKYLILRPYYLCGKYDYTNRFDYSHWPTVFWKKSNIEVKYNDIIEFTDILVSSMEEEINGIITGEY